jgi:hypothetical protein
MDKPIEQLMLVMSQGYLRTYDREAFNGQGAATYTRDPAEAVRFPSLHCVKTLANATPHCRPVCADGQPNRPLTAFTLFAVPAAKARTLTTTNIQ